MVAVVALLVAGVVSDPFAGQFWDHHALLAGLASSAIVVLLSAALVGEAVGRPGVGAGGCSLST